MAFYGSEAMTCDQPQQLVSGHCVVKFQRRSTLSRNSSLAVTEQPIGEAVIDLYEQASTSEKDTQDDMVTVQVVDDEDQGYNSGKSSNTSPETKTDDHGTPQRKKHVQFLRTTLNRVCSLSKNRQNLNRPTVLLNPCDLSQSWQGVEKFLHQRLRGSDPESMKPNKKPFWMRTWFSMVCYAVIAMLLLATILAVASYIVIIRPKIILKGEIILQTTPRTILSQNEAFSQSQSSVTDSSTTVDTTTVTSPVTVQYGSTTESSTTDSTTQFSKVNSQIFTTAASLPEVTWIPALFPLSVDSAMSTTASPFAHLLSLPGPML